MKFLLSSQKDNSVLLVDRLNDYISGKYQIFLQAVLRNGKFKILAGAVIFMALCFFMNIGNEFLPRIDDGRVMVKLKMPSGTSVGLVDRILKDVENELSDDKNI